ncbi:MAG: glutamate synthase (NADPH), homotetrameric [Candidatus Schekmanbacteria bacterium RIFCSPHIGHO2_02_FULL_38_11]|uniref:Glutamate synthase (NADPH), homotetrameric n=1 Tax=Candidatus Schekmanbacteria bacterium RIFCSPLOWO2_12_FULL_38_15 TaxID=1817883 RepID=A0A1F7SIL5_9BACT|nr:MAG: glutamate synthase (NADPH), homotetrameric [Candidatus Schekmanbacteria bacterium GWA2_38_9]OGL49714.1 MAG: glutamate synthase (NADPH), homotetrameric [Candidatus Schekmanbacteria bacterium RIFCSPLOWO2_02_FULL_38_14]OGL53068.1 MAG: glutamate synthase (NADPH), homotetrameric [Candidatus Schekmanbacteria bacterium RIFCSPLOWO2_12_FULL_38_15]OGL53771.1 MAG: glutamate synthase (NADPH), homotetrameric [Candidatus Schekmanbacteria bacterium RIFCSPHIGHO2_02_FULL_38_11]
MSEKIDPKKRMKIPRQKMPEQEPEKRKKNFEQVNFGLPPEIARIEAQRCIQCKKPFCVGGCPVGIDIPGFIRLIAEGDFIGAARKLKEKNTLPAVCGRVCPQEEQCEVPCIIGKKGAPVAIGNLERFAADFEQEYGEIKIPDLPKSTGKKVAIVGSGPAGLTAAGELVKSGHRVTIFEALHKPGGVLIYGIPEFRLPKKILEKEINYIKSLGVEIVTNYVVGKTETLDELLSNGFHAAFLGTGAGLPYFMNIPGENLNGVYSANEYLTRVNLMKAYLFPDYDTPVFSGKRVAVVGGGNTAMDAVRTSKRLGAKHSYIIYRRSRNEMPARVEEIKHAEEEGIEFVLLTNPTKIIGDEKGWVNGIECLKMELGEPDASGRRKPVPIKNSEYVIDVDTVVIAIGNGANPLIPMTTGGLKTNKYGYIVADPKNCATSKKGVFAGGDIVRGGATVILAMGDGKTAASAINEYLK